MVIHIHVQDCVCVICSISEKAHQHRRLYPHIARHWQPRPDVLFQTPVFPDGPVFFELHSTSNSGKYCTIMPIGSVTSSITWYFSAPLRQSRQRHTLRLWCRIVTMELHAVWLCKQQQQAVSLHPPSQKSVEQRGWMCPHSLFYCRRQWQGGSSRPL